MTTPDRPPRRIRRLPAQPAGMVLVVDDDPLVGQVLHRSVAGAGLPALLATGPAEAISMAARYPIAALVTDLSMPGMTGVELAARIREGHPLIPVVLVSGSPEADDEMIAQPSAFLAKPVATGQLAIALASFAAVPTRAR